MTNAVLTKKTARTSLPDVTRAVTATTHEAVHGVVKPMITSIAMATRNAIQSIASAAQRTVEQVLLRMMPLMIGFLAILFSTSGIRAFCIDAFGRLT
jgi:sorbitol-specific phosphotransferase system component IIBC